MDWKLIRRRKGKTLGNEVCITPEGRLYIPRHLLHSMGMEKAHRVALEANTETNQLLLRMPNTGDPSTYALITSRTGSLLWLREALRILGKRIPPISTRVPAVVVENKLLITLNHLENRNG